VRRASGIEEGGDDSVPDGYHNENDGGWSMNDQPTMQPIVKPDLQVKPPFFVTQILHPLQVVEGICRELGSKHVE
jgi:hypothetical protein